MSLRNLEKKGKFISWPWPTCLLHPPSPFWLVVWRCKVAGHSLHTHASVGTLALGRHSPLVPPQMSSPPHSGPAPAAWESQWSSYLWAFDLFPLPHHSWAHMLLKIVTWLYLWIFSTKTILVSLQIFIEFIFSMVLIFKKIVINYFKHLVFLSKGTGMCPIGGKSVMNNISFSFLLYLSGIYEGHIPYFISEVSNSEIGVRQFPLSGRFSLLSMCHCQHRLTGCY